jgi:hypothetical protein
LIAVPNQDFLPDKWWQEREGKKVALLEWTKTVATWFGP